MTCDFDGQVVELQIRDAIMNRFSIFGIPQTQRAG